MKRYYILLVAALFFLSSMASGYGIVNNSGTAGADSLTVPFFALDSAGNMVDMASGDSVFFSVYYPDGTIAYQDSGAYNDGKITSQGVSSYTHYVWKEAVADIDGGSPSEGTYGYVLVVNDLTSAAIATPHRGHFQLYATADFDVTLDELAAVLDTLQLWDTRVDSIEAALADGSISDKVWADGSPSIRAEIEAILDSIQNHDDWIAKEATIQIVDDSIDVYDTRWDELAAILDTLQNHDDWVAKEASLFDPSTDSVIVDVSAAAADNGLCEVVADSVWDEVLTGATHNVATSAGRRLRNAEAGVILTEGTAQSGAASTITLDAGESATNDIFNHSLLVITGGTGIGQSHSISDYDGGTKVATVTPAWRVQPDNTSTYTIHAFGEVDVYKLETNVITASSIADDAIDYATFAGSAPTAWWNEGKTGYSLVATEWEEVWRNIDTTNIDTSEVGIWFSTGINASISAANIATIADSVWGHKDTAWASATIGDQLTDLTDGVNTIQISGDATAADNLETMLDGTGGQVFSANISGTITGFEASGYASFIDSMLGIAVSDTVTGRLMSVLLDIVDDNRDTLRNQDNWVATSANQTLIIDTVNAIIDTVQNFDDWIASAASLVNAIDSINAVLDTLQNIDNWAAQQTWLDSLILWDNYKLGTLSKTTYANDSDNVLMLSGVDTLGGWTFYHVGDAAGDPPDSVKFFPLDSLR